MNELNPPFFMHSLFRSGSTYIFNKIRGKQDKVISFQEAMHEFVYECRENQELLVKGHDSETMLMYRHPILEKPYWQELYDIYPEWADNIKEKNIYDEFFDDQKTQSDVNFWKSIIDTIPKDKAPFFQECRTFGRIRSIKKELGGTHIGLFRNPVDQWKSYYVTSYFNAINLVLLTSKSAPIELLEIGKIINPKKSASNKYKSKIDFYKKNELNPEKSYTLFFVIWMIAMREMILNCDVLISINQLSVSRSYQSETKSKFEEMGFVNIEFDDCSITTYEYDLKERGKYLDIENNIYKFLIEIGWEETLISKIKKMVMDKFYG